MLTTLPHSYFLVPTLMLTTPTHSYFLVPTLLLTPPPPLPPPTLIPTHAHHTPTLILPSSPLSSSSSQHSYSPHLHTRTSPSPHSCSPHHHTRNSLSPQLLLTTPPHSHFHTRTCWSPPSCSYHPHTCAHIHKCIWPVSWCGCTVCLRGSISEYKCVNSLYSVSCRILLQYLRMNNRIMFIVALLISVAAAVLLADWQSLPYDPCTEFSLYYHPELVERYKQEIKNSSGLVPRDISLEHYGGLLWEKSADGMPLYSVVNETLSAIVSHHPSANRINKEVIDLAVNKCESLYTSLHCHWTPMSLITGKDCPDCRLLCRSVDKTLNFIQFCLGAALLLISVPSVRVSLVNVITDYVNKQIQVSDEIALISASNTLGF